eukprot:2704126-Pyramimonas_sp.AAC.1
MMISTTTTVVMAIVMVTVMFTIMTVMMVTMGRRWMRTTKLMSGGELGVGRVPWALQYSVQYNQATFSGGRGGGDG